MFTFGNYALRFHKISILEKISAYWKFSAIIIRLCKFCEIWVKFFLFSAQTDKTDDNRYDLEVKSVKLQKEIAELDTRIKSIKGIFFNIFRKISIFFQKKNLFSEKNFNFFLVFRKIQEASIEACTNFGGPNVENASRLQRKSHPSRHALAIEEKINSFFTILQNKRPFIIVFILYKTRVGQQKY